MNPTQYVMGNTTVYRTGDDAEQTQATTRPSTQTTTQPSTQTTTQPASSNAGSSVLPANWSFLNDPKYKDLPGTSAYRNFALGKGFTGNLVDETPLKDFKFFGQDVNSLKKYINEGLSKQITPENAQKALTQQYEKAQQDKLYNEYFRTTKEGYTFPKNPNIKVGTKGYGGATFGLNTFYSRQYSQNVSKTQGAGAWSIGIDPRDPRAEALATAWIENNKNRQDGPGTPWNKILGSGQWGRFDAKMPGLAALKAKYPKASNLALLDAVVRMSHSQAALEPVDDTMSILGPIMVAAGGFLGPLAATAVGSTMAGSTAAALGAGSMGALSSGIQSDWDLGSMLLGGGSAALSAGMGFNPAATTAQNLTKAGIQTAIGATRFIDPNLPTALNFANAAYGGVQSGDFTPLLRRGASYAFQNLVPGPYGRLGGMAIEYAGKDKKDDQKRKG